MKDFPLASHQFARKAATASHCAEEQGKFWEMSDAMFADQLKLSPADLLATAQTLGLDADRFKTCVESDKFDPALAKAATDAAAAGVRGVPVFYIGQPTIDVLLGRIRLRVGKQSIEVGRVGLILPVMLERVEVRGARYWGCRRGDRCHAGKLAI